MHIMNLYVLRYGINIPLYNVVVFTTNKLSVMDLTGLFEELLSNVQEFMHNYAVESSSANWQW